MLRATASRAAAATALAGLLASCAAPPEAGPSEAQAMEAIEETVSAFFEAYERGDADSVVTFFTEDASLLPPGGETVTGHGALLPHIEAGLSLGRWVQSTPTDTIVVVGDHAIHSGRYRIDFLPTEATPQGMAAFSDSGRYMIHWTQAGGRWRMARYIANR